MSILICTTHCKKTGSVSLDKSCDKKQDKKPQRSLNSLSYQRQISNEKPLTQVPSSVLLLQNTMAQVPFSLPASTAEIIIVLVWVLESNNAKFMKQRGEFSCTSSEYEAFETKPCARKHSMASNTQIAFRAAGSEAQEQPFRVESTLLPNTQINTTLRVSKARRLKRAEKELPRQL